MFFPNEFTNIDVLETFFPFPSLLSRLSVDADITYSFEIGRERQNCENHRSWFWKLKSIWFNLINSAFCCVVIFFMWSYDKPLSVCCCPPPSRNVKRSTLISHALLTYCVKNYVTSGPCSRAWQISPMLHFDWVLIYNLNCGIQPLKLQNVLDSASLDPFRHLAQVFHSSRRN